MAKFLQINDIHMQYVIFTTYDERRDGQVRIGTSTLKDRTRANSLYRQKPEEPLLGTGPRGLCQDLGQA